VDLLIHSKETRRYDAVDVELKSASLKILWIVEVPGSALDPVADVTSFLILAFGGSLKAESVNDETDFEWELKKHGGTLR
jgi:hypothetical protein